MSLPKFTYEAPATLAEALAGAGEGTALVSGGTDLFVRMKERLTTPGRVLGLSAVGELRGIRPAGDGGLRIGAASTLTEVAADGEVRARAPWLAETVELTASPLLRNAGTVGGNLCQESRCSHYNQPPIFRKRWGPCFKLGGDVCHVVKGGDRCYAIYSGDLAGPLVAAGASVALVGTGNARTMPVQDLFTGSGLRPVSLAAGDILTEVRIPTLPEGSGISYQKLRLRDTIDYPLAGVAAFLALDGQGQRARCREARLVLCAVGPAPVVVEEAAECLRGREPTPEVLSEASLLVQKRSHPVANAASSPSYRRRMVPVLARQALAAALERALAGGR